MRLRFTCLITLALLPSPALFAADLDDALAKINQVGPKGEGAAAAATAVQTLTQASAEDLITLLAAINDEHPLAANYIRSAIETIAQREKNKLPADHLEQFVTNTKNNQRARRLAYELLLRAEPKAEQRLLPKLLNDPSVEIRRDAVAAKMDEASKIKLKSNAIAVYQSAFDAAVDDDQVKAIAKRLQDLGAEVDIARHYGFLLSWHVVGPFDNADEKGFDTPSGPEGKAIDLSDKFKGSHDLGEVTWQAVTSDDDYGQIDLNKSLGKHKSAVSYAVTTYNAEQPRPAQLRYKSKNACKLWLNGKLVDQREVYHSDGGPSLDQYQCDVMLTQGKNTIVLKVCQNDQDQPWAQSWGFQLRVCDTAGAALRASDTKKTASVSQ